MKNVILFGNGDLAEVVAYYLESDSDYKVAAFTIDGENIKEEKFLEKDVVALIQVFLKFSLTRFFILPHRSSAS